MRVGLLADTHDRVPAIASCCSRCRRAASTIVMHAGDYCSPFALQPFQDHSCRAGRRLRPQRRRPRGAACARRSAASARELFESPHSFELGGKRILLVHDLGDVQPALDRRRTTIVVHGFTHQQEMKTRGDTLHRESRARRAAGSTARRAAAILDLDTEAGRVPQARPVREWTVLTCSSRILILDFGSQFTQLIARRVREAHVYCEIHPPTRSLEWIREWKPKGIILSRRAELGVRRGRADGRSGAARRRAGARRLLRHAAASRTSQGGKVIGAGRREYGRAERHGRWSRRALPRLRRRRGDARSG